MKPDAIPSIFPLKTVSIQDIKNNKTPAEPKSPIKEEDFEEIPNGNKVNNLKELKFKLKGFELPNQVLAQFQNEQAHFLKIGEKSENVPIILYSLTVSSDMKISICVNGVKVSGGKLEKIIGDIEKIEFRCQIFDIINKLESGQNQEMIFVQPELDFVKVEINDIEQEI